MNRPPCASRRAPARQLATALSGDRAGEHAAVEPSAWAEDADIWPLLAEDHKDQPLAAWLAERIIEVESAVGRLPSVAVFVDGGAHIDPLVDGLGPLLADRNIRVVGCPGGRVVGDDLEVRVFDVQHIKGLEFEAVFFVGIDRLAERLPALFDRFFYVGVSRAATYLGVTCEGRLPAGWNVYACILMRVAGRRSDYCHSNVANSFVYTPGKPTRVQDVFDLLRQQVAASKLAFLKGKDHVYMEVIKWADNEHLKIRVWGHGDGAEFDRQFTVLIPHARG